MHNKSRNTIGYRKAVSGFILLAFLTGQIFTPMICQAQVMPLSETILGLSPRFSPPVLLGLKIHPENPLLFDFIVDRGTSNLSDEEFKIQTQKLVKYFLAALTIPDKQVWVNLSPYEKDRIIPDALGQTQMGKAMLEQDYILKQLASSLTNPETDLGKKYWNAVNGESIPVGNRHACSLQNKVWIVPAKAKVLESKGIVVIDETQLKVMIDEEVGAQALSSPHALSGDPLSKIDSRFRGNDMKKVSTQVFRDLILPKIVEEVNEGKDFAAVRQVYNSVILAAWYKQALKESLLGKVYMDKAKVAGVETDDKQMKQGIYEQYLEAFKKGAYNFIKEEDDENGELIPRKYFSGGIAEFGVSSSGILERENSASGVEPKLLASAPTLEIVTVLGDEQRAASTVEVQVKSAASGRGIAFVNTSNTAGSSGITSKAIAAIAFSVMLTTPVFGNSKDQSLPTNYFVEKAEDIISVRNKVGDHIDRFTRQDLIQKLMVDGFTAEEAEIIYDEQENMINKFVPEWSKDVRSFLHRNTTRFTSDDSWTLGQTSWHQMELRTVSELGSNDRLRSVVAHETAHIIFMGYKPPKVFDEEFDWTHSIVYAIGLLRYKELGHVDEEFFNKFSQRYFRNIINFDYRVGKRLAEDAYELEQQHKGRGWQYLAEMMNKKDEVKNMYLLPKITSPYGLFLAGLLPLTFWAIRRTSSIKKTNKDSSEKIDSQPDNNVAASGVAKTISIGNLESLKQFNETPPTASNLKEPDLSSSSITDSDLQEWGIPGQKYIPKVSTVRDEVLGISFQILYPNNGSSNAPVLFSDRNSDIPITISTKLGTLQLDDETVIPLTALQNNSYKPLWDWIDRIMVGMTYVKAELLVRNEPGLQGNYTQLLEQWGSLKLRMETAGKNGFSDFRFLPQIVGSKQSQELQSQLIQMYGEQVYLQIKDAFLGHSLIFVPVIFLNEEGKYFYGKIIIRDDGMALFPTFTADGTALTFSPITGRRATQVRDIMERASHVDQRIKNVWDVLDSLVGKDLSPGSESSSSGVTPVGGIDFDPTLLNLQIKRDGKGVPLPLPEQNIENINIDGLYPVIINIQPVNAQTLPLLLGQKSFSDANAKLVGT